MALRSDLTKFEQVPVCFAGWNGDIEQVTRGPFAGTLRVARGRLLRVTHMVGSQSLLVRGRESADLFSINPVLAGNAGGVWHGRQLAPGQLVVRGPDTGIDHRSVRKTEYLGMTVPVAALEAAARALAGRELHAGLRSWAVLDPRPEDARALLAAAARFLGDDATGSVVPDADGLEDECLRLLVRALAPDDPPDVLAPPARSQVARRAEELMRGRLREPIGVVELCAALGVSDRTLRLVFKEQFGCGPVTYYRRLRLHAARARIVAGAAVAAAARECGFTHLGNFAADYRRHFGELPSETGRG